MKPISKELRELAIKHATKEQITEIETIEANLKEQQEEENVSCYVNKLSIIAGSVYIVIMIGQLHLVFFIDKLGQKYDIVRHKDELVTIPVTYDPHTRAWFGIQK